MTTSDRILAAWDLVVHAGVHGRARAREHVRAHDCVHVDADAYELPDVDHVALASPYRHVAASSPIRTPISAQVATQEPAAAAFAVAPVAAPSSSVFQLLQHSLPVLAYSEEHLILGRLPQLLNAALADA